MSGIHSGSALKKTCVNVCLRQCKNKISVGLSLWEKYDSTSFWSISPSQRPTKQKSHANSGSAIIQDFPQPHACALSLLLGPPTWTVTAQGSTGMTITVTSVRGARSQLPWYVAICFSSSQTHVWFLSDAMHDVRAINQLFAVVGILENMRICTRDSSDCDTQQNRSILNASEGRRSPNQKKGRSFSKAKPLYCSIGSLHTAHAENAATYGTL
jgi:hypothetical protein